MAPQDDLTAERAAKLIKDLFVLHLDDDGEPDETDVLALVDLQKTARQEALREAARVVRDRALLWQSHGGAKIGFPYGHLTIEGEYESMASELDRLASEGA